MHTVELLEQALALAENLGYSVRQEWLGGIGGGACQFKGRKLFFLDLSLPTGEQFPQLADALRLDPGLGHFPISAALARALGVRQIA